MNDGVEHRRNLSTAVRRAVWEAHERKCAYTGEPIDWSELEIDHIIPIKGDVARISGLRSKGVIDSEFDINGFENLIPTKRHRNRQKTNFIANEGAIVYYLSVADKAKSKAERLHASSLASELALKGYLQIKTQAESNDISVEDLVGYLRHQTDGEAFLRVSPEVDGVSISHANSEFAAVLMDKPFALGGGSITEVNLRDEQGIAVVCRTANEFISAKSSGYWPFTQYDINCFGLADQTSELLRAVRKSTYALRAFITRTTGT